MWILLLAFLMVLWPSTAFAFPLEGEIRGFANTVQQWVVEAVSPDAELWWLCILSLPLTICWMVMWRQLLRKPLAGFAGVVVCGGGALYVLNIGVGLLLAPIRWLTDEIGLPVWVAVIILLILTTTFLGTLIKWVWGLTKDAATKVWDARSKFGDAIPAAILGGMILAGVLNGAFAVRLTEKSAFPGLIPAGSACLGLLSLLATDPGKALLGRMGWKFKNFLPEKGWWRCVAVGYPVSLVNGQRVVGSRLVRCKGPRGKDAKGIEHRGWNRKEYSRCHSDTCDAQNWAWQICEACGFAGEDGDNSGFRRELDQGVGCPKCKHWHPPIPRQVAFHLPGEDLSHPSPDATSANQAETPDHAELAEEAIEIELDTSKLVRCASCGKQTPDAFGCRECGQPLSEKARRVRKLLEGGW